MESKTYAKDAEQGHSSMGADTHREAKPDFGGLRSKAPEHDTRTEGILTGRHEMRHLSVLGPSLSFKGELHCEEDLLIQGRVDGTITHNAKNLTIGTHGEVQADIVAQRVIIQGNVRGDVWASESVVVEPSAQVEGNLFAPSIGLKEGAKFKGSIDMDASISDRSASKSSNASGGGGKKSKKSAERKGVDEDAEELSDATVSKILD